MPQSNIIDIDSNKKQRAAEMFLNWVGKNISETARQKILDEVDAESNGLGAADTVISNETGAPVATSVPWYERVLNVTEKVLPAYQQYKMQEKIIKMQLERARNGQPPLNVEQYSAPPVRVQVQPTFTGQLAPSTKRMLWIGGGLLAALLLWPSIKRALK